MDSFSEFNSIPAERRAIVSEAIRRYSLYPDKNRLIIPLFIQDRIDPVVVEVPIDEPSLGMLIIFASPMRYIKAMVRLSPRNQAYNARMKTRGIKPLNHTSNALQGLCVYEFDQTESGIEEVDQHVNMQIHQLFNMASQKGDLASRRRNALVCRYTNVPGQPKTSDGCAAIASWASFKEVGGFNDPYVYDNLDELKKGTWFELGPAPVLIKLAGQQQVYNQSLDQFKKRPSDLSTFECSVLIGQYCKEVLGIDFSDV